MRIGGGGSRTGATRTPDVAAAEAAAVPARQPRATGGSGRHAVPAVPSRPGMSRPPQRWIGSAPDRKGAEPERSVHRGSRRIRLQTPRAGRWRNGGLAECEIRTASSSRSIVPLASSREAASPRVRQDPGVPRRPHFFAAVLGWRDSGAKASARTGAAEFGRTDDTKRELQARLPSPGGGGSASAEGASRGGVALKRKESPHPDAHYVRVDPAPPGEGNGGTLPTTRELVGK